MSINVSPLQLISEGFSEMIKSALRKHEIPYDQLIVEITETALMYNNSDIQSVLRELSAAGIKIALDDFGTGFSSISHLMNFPVNIVKVDKSLFQLENGQLKHMSLLRGLVIMLQGLDLLVIAEGVEHHHQHVFCEELKLDKLQGFLFGKPVPLSRLTDA
jgi:EAL domain-containing protein (putative c-di-GMP-specific phosphodiesterase class I)